MASGKNPSPGHHAVVTHLTPEIGDLLFYESHDSRKPQYAPGYEEYGSPHPNKEKYPDHELVFVEPSDTEGWANWWYAAKPEDQDRYNFTQTYPFAGIPWASQITRAYFVKRDDYSPLSKGIPDNEHPKAYLTEEVQQKIGVKQMDSLYVLVVRTYTQVPSYDEQSTYNAEISYPYNGSEKFPRYSRKYIVLRSEYEKLDPATAHDPEHAEGILVSERMDRFDPDPMDSVYVLQSVVFDVVPEADDLVEGGDATGFGYSVSYPHGEDEYPRVTWRYKIETANYVASEGKALCPIAGYTTLKLTGQDAMGSSEDIQMTNVARVYDVLPGPERETESNKAHFRAVPEQFVRTSVETVIKQNVESGTAPDSLAPHPTGVSQGSIPTDVGGALVEARVVENESKIVASRELVRLETTFGSLKGTEMESYTGKPLTFEQTLVPAGTVGTDADANGNYTEVSPRDQVWSVQTNRKTTDLAGNSRTYTTYINGVFWPAVLVQYPTFAEVKDVNGELHHYIVDYEIKSAYSGPTKADITEEWYAPDNPPTPTAPVVLLPEPLNYQGLMVSLRIPSTLHDTFSITENTGTSHPTLSYSVRSKTWSATNYTDWPSSYLYRSELSPWKGGWMYRKTTVYAPNT